MHVILLGTGSILVILLTCSFVAAMNFFRRSLIWHRCRLSANQTARQGITIYSHAIHYLVIFCGRGRVFHEQHGNAQSDQHNADWFFLVTPDVSKWSTANQPSRREEGKRVILILFFCRSHFDCATISAWENDRRLKRPQFFPNDIYWKTPSN